MKSLFVVLTFIALSLIAARPALAQAEDVCPHDAATVESLRECVQHASTHGFIDNAGVTRSLLAKLDAAQAAVDRGQPSLAVNILKAFVQAVEAQSGQHIAPEHAGRLVEHAQLVIQALGG